MLWFNGKDIKPLKTGRYVTTWKGNTTFFALDYEKDSDQWFDAMGNFAEMPELWANVIMPKDECTVEYKPIPYQYFRIAIQIILDAVKQDSIVPIPAQVLEWILNRLETYLESPHFQDWQKSEIRTIFSELMDIARM